MSSEREVLYHQGLQKRGEVWCGGARETREPRVTIGFCYQKRTFSKISPVFKILMAKRLGLVRKCSPFSNKTLIAYPSSL